MKEQEISGMREIDVDTTGAKFSSRRLKSAKMCGVHSRGEAENRSVSLLKICGSRKIGRAMLDYLRGWHYQAIRPRRRWCFRSRHRRFVIGLEVLAWAGATKWLVSPLRVSCPHPLVLFSSAVANRTSSRDGCIKHFATTICDTFVRNVRAFVWLCVPSPSRKVSWRG